MSVDTLNKNVLKMLSHLNKYPIPDPQMVKDFKWFINTYNLSVRSGEVTAPGSGPSPEGYVNDVIFSGLSFAPTSSLIVNTGVITNASSGVISDMYGGMPNMTFNSNRVIGVNISLASSSGLQPSDTFDLVAIDEDDVESTIVEGIDVGTIQTGYTFGYVDITTEDNVYSVNPSTFEISSPNYTFYRQLELKVNTINGAGIYIFQLTYHFV
jgi:hypothetical protein